MKKDELTVKTRKEIFVRTLILTADAKKAVVAAGYKPTKHNINRQIERLKKDAFVTKRYRELLDEVYPVEERAKQIADLARRAQELAMQSTDPKEVIAVMSSIDKLSPATPQPTQVQHQHLHAAVGVVPPLPLPKE